MRCALVILVLLTAPALATEPGNLLVNPDLEQPGKNAPASWRAMTLWGPDAQFAVDKSEKHSGEQSFRIIAKEPSQSWLMSDWVPVVSGETLEASAWVRAKDVALKGVNEDEGVVLVANFVEGDDRTEQFADFTTLNRSSSGWAQLSGTTKVPARAAKVRLRIGFREGSGTLWIDDAKLLASEPLAARADLKYPRLTPEMGGVPVLIINRDGRKTKVNIRASTIDNIETAAFDLTGEREQRVTVPLTLGVRPQQTPLKVELFEGDDKEPLHVEKREVQVPPPLVLSPIIPTHWAVEDGPATIEGDIDLAEDKYTRANSTLRAIALDAQQKEVAQWNEPQPADGINHFSIKLPKLPVGSYEVEIQRLDKKPDPSGPGSVRVSQPFVMIHRADSETHVNALGFIEYKGKPIFPLGIFNGPAKVKEMGDAGFTINHAYNAANVEPGEQPHDDEAKEFLDDTEANGMKALFLIPRGLAFSGDWENFRRRIRMFKNHPALLAWDEEEGLARGDMDMKSLIKMREIIREEDPHHPLMIGDSRDVITNIKDRSNFFPLEQMDLGMWWWYPIPAGAGKANMLEGDEKTKAEELIPPSFLTLRNTDKPLWVGVQAYKKPPSWARYPTPAEYRAQAYIAIIHGAKGLMWYGGSVEDGIFIDPKKGKWDALKTLARELNDLSPVFMGETLESPKFTPADAPISVALKRGGGRTILMAVNRGTHALDISFANGVKHHFDAYETFVHKLTDEQ